MQNLDNTACLPSHSLLTIFFSFPTFSDHVREFTCGKHYYRNFLLQEHNEALYVGAM